MHRFLESREALALGLALAQAPVRGGGWELPTELLPFPTVEPKRRSLARRIIVAILVWILALHACYILATGILISIYSRIDPPATVLMAYRKWGYGWKIEPPRPVKLKTVPRYIRNMLVSVEDGKFYEHHGLDFEAFARAREINKRIGKPLYGGSTLTMQVARTLFLVPEKSYLRKYLEVIAALELEALLPKSRILELYFGYAEWGKGIFGMEAAARKWYGAGMADLSRDQAARLIALLSSPIKYGPSTLYKNGILRERYAYLAGNYAGAPPAPAPIETAPPPQAAAQTPAAQPEAAAPGAESSSPDTETEAATPELPLPPSDSAPTPEPSVLD
jgi:Membrane carboxypeptidase (penicillin-binding protein)